MIKEYQLFRNIIDLRLDSPSASSLPEHLGTFYSLSEAMDALPKDYPDAGNPKVSMMGLIIDLDRPAPSIIATCERGAYALRDDGQWVITMRFRGDRSELPGGACSEKMESFFQLADLIEGFIPDLEDRKTVGEALQKFILKLWLDATELEQQLRMAQLNVS